MRKKQEDKYHTNPDICGYDREFGQNVGRVCHAIDSLGIANNTIVVFFSDNGGSEPVTDNYPLREGKGAPYEGEHEFP